MDDVSQKKRILQSEISRILQEMISLKMNAVKDSVHATTGKALTQKVPKYPGRTFLNVTATKYVDRRFRIT